MRLNCISYCFSLVPLRDTTRASRLKVLERSLRASSDSASSSASVTNYYSYTGTVQTFTVPYGVTTITVQAFGAQGGAGYYSGGYGGYVFASLKVIPGQVLYLYVGGAGSKGYSNAYPSGGYNGGGYGSSNYCYSGGYWYSGGGGGGATDIRTTSGMLASRIVVAGGGGGGSCYGSGMAGGGSSPSDGGYGGGTYGSGGDAYYNGYGGGGGGGYIGGGGGSTYNGGGGGSSYVNGTVLGWSSGYNSGSGYLYILFTPAPSSSPTSAPTTAYSVIQSKVECRTFIYIDSGSH